MKNNISNNNYLEKCFLSEYPNLEASTVCVIKAAIKHKLNYEVLDENRSFIKISNDKKEEYLFQATKTSKDISTFPFITDNKALVKDILRENNLSTPDGILLNDNMSKTKKEELINSYVGQSVVVKPNTTNKGTGITVFENPVSKEALENAVNYAFKFDSHVIIEEYKRGLEYRFLVVGDKCICVIHRRGASVLGTGKDTINELINEKNKEPWHYLNGNMITIDDGLKNILKEQNYTLNSIPSKGKRVFLRHNSNCSTGGESIDLTETIPDEFKRIAVKAAKLFNANICGVDILINNLNRYEYTIVELNDNPGIGICECPYEGKGKPIGEAILRLLEFIK